VLCEAEPHSLNGILNCWSNDGPEGALEKLDSGLEFGNREPDVIKTTTAHALSLQVGA
jgi:hypothetical protein